MNGDVELAGVSGLGAAVYGFPSHEHLQREEDEVSPSQGFLRPERLPMRWFTAGAMAGLVGTRGKMDLRSTIRCGRGMGRKRRRR